MLPSNRFSAKVCCLIVVRVCDQIRTSCSDRPLHSDLPSHNDSAANQCRSLPFSPAGDERGCARRTTTSPPSPISLSHTGKRSGRLFAGTAQQGDQTSYQRRRGLPPPRRAAAAGRLRARRSPRRMAGRRQTLPFETTLALLRPAPDAGDQSVAVPAAITASGNKAGPNSPRHCPKRYRQGRWPRSWAPPALTRGRPAHRLDTARPRPERDVGFTRQSRSDGEGFKPVGIDAADEGQIDDQPHRKHGQLLGDGPVQPMRCIARRSHSPSQGLRPEEASARSW